MLTVGVTELVPPCSPKSTLVNPGPFPAPMAMRPIRLGRANWWCHCRHRWCKNGEKGRELADRKQLAIGQSVPWCKVAGKPVYRSDQVLLRRFLLGNTPQQ